VLACSESSDESDSLVEGSTGSNALQTAIPESTITTIAANANMLFFIFCFFTSQIFYTTLFW
jgi:hypothetical protein